MNLFKFLCTILSIGVLACSEQSRIPHESPQVDGDINTILTIHTEEGFDEESYLSNTEGEGNFNLIDSQNGIALLVSEQDYPGVLKVADHFKRDLELTTLQEVKMVHSLDSATGQVIIVGSMGQSPLINQISKSHPSLQSGLDHKREKFIVEVVDLPLAGVQRALVIAGSDKRGAIYGMYDFAAELGVSPWYWWADVPVKQRPRVYVKPGQHAKGEPKVKYRGIFINDEAPALAGWAQEKFDGFNHLFYEKVFELILRNKGNYLWPAMWGRSIYDDDPQSPELADMYGVVLGTSHHEPLMRAHVEWSRYGEGDWDYEQNKQELQDFWRKGIQRMGDNESIVTIGMRGDGDEAMTEGTAISLLENIVKDQRQIIIEETGKPASETPQMWALYKEVQEYYDKGMRVPDDVTLLLCDDNWGNIRKLPQLGDTLREGGYGIYYHFDYVGGPRNYKWLNTTQVSRVWEQMNLAYQHGVDQVWIVNVGDIKPMEFPTSFFLDYAWDPDRIMAEDIPGYGEQWATQQFGTSYAKEIAHLLHKYTQFNSRRKPELLSSETYSLATGEFERVVKEWQELVAQAEQIAQSLPSVYQSSFYQLVEFPIRACSNLNAMYLAVAKNRLYATQGRVLTNEMADRAEELFEHDEQLTETYHQLMNGKWNHMMSQTHIGYTYWQQPDKQSMPDTKNHQALESARMGVSPQGSDQWYPGSKNLQLPVYQTPEDQYYFEVFNQGNEPFKFLVNPKDDFLKFSNTTGTVNTQERISVSIDWDQVEENLVHTSFQVMGADDSVAVSVKVDRVDPSVSLVEKNGVIVIEAANFTKKVNTEKVQWIEVPQLGLTRSSIIAAPVTPDPTLPGGNSSHLAYEVQFSTAGEVSIQAVFSPTLNFHNEPDGLEYAISIDGESPQVIGIHKDWTPQDWGKAVSTNRINATSTHIISEAGVHLIKFWLVDSGLALQRLEAYTSADFTKNYLGPTGSVQLP